MRKHLWKVQSNLQSSHLITLKKQPCKCSLSSSVKLRCILLQTDRGSCSLKKAFPLNMPATQCSVMRVENLGNRIMDRGSGEVLAKHKTRPDPESEIRKFYLDFGEPSGLKGLFNKVKSERLLVRAKSVDNAGRAGWGSTVAAVHLDCTQSSINPINWFSLNDELERHTDLHARVVSYAAPLRQQRHKHVRGLHRRHVAHTRAGQLPERLSTFLLLILQWSLPPRGFFLHLLHHLHRFYGIQTPSLAVVGRTVRRRRRRIQLHRGDGGQRRGAGQLLLNLLIVLQPGGVEDRGDEGRGDSGEDPHSRLGSGDVLGFAEAELMRGAAPYRRAALDIGALVTGREINVQRDGVRR